MLNLICYANAEFIIIILQRLWRTGQDATFEQSYTKYLIYL